MQDLNRIQLQLQQSAEDKLKEQIEQLEKKSVNKELLLIKLIKNLSKEIYKYKKEHFKEVIKKLVIKYEDEFKNRFSFNNKNIQNYISLALSNSLINYIDKNSNSIAKDLEALKENKNFKELKISEYKKIVSYLYSLYRDELENIFTKQLKEKQQYTSSIISLISSTKLAYIVVTFILQIQAYENEKSEDFNALSRQNRGDELFNSIKRELKSIDFIPDKQKQLIAQALIDFLIEQNLIQESKKNDTQDEYITIETTEHFEEIISDIKDKLTSVRIRYNPMVIEPIPWSDIDNGGFIRGNKVSDDFNNLLLIKHNINNKLERNKILKQKGKIPKEILNAINTIQNVPYKINKNILTILKQIESQKLKYHKGKVDKKYYKKLEYYIGLIESNSIKTLTRLEEILTNKFINWQERDYIEDYLKKLNQEKKYYKEAFEIYNNKEKKINFKIENKLIKLQNSLDIMFEIADEFKEYNKIYFVWQIDFRGRIYPVQTLLNPQGGDVAKSLLLFDKEQKLNDRGIFWFKVHGANLYGEVDKDIFEKRLEWIEKNEQNILNSAKNPLKESFWKEADEPFEFLAFCFEYEKYYKNRDNFYTSLPVAIDGSNNGLQHISTLLFDPISAKNVNVLPDNKVNDIYSLIAKTLEEILKTKEKEFENSKDKYIQKDGYYFELVQKHSKEPRVYAKNLINKIEKIDIANLQNQSLSTYLKSELKTDEYKYLSNIEKQIKQEYKDSSLSKIKRKLIRALENDIEDLNDDIEEEKVKIIDNKFYKTEEVEVIVKESILKEFFEKIGTIDRKFVKKPVMTDSYGSTTRGKANTIYDELKNKMENSKYLKEFSHYLAELIEESIAKNSKSSVAYENFIKDVADLILKTDNHISWKTPLNFEVMQNEYKTKKESINLLDGGKITIHTFIDKIDKRKHKSGILPNFIHSLDATHLYKTINRANLRGLNYFLTVHDSFATYPNDMDTLANTLKEEFINLYKEPILENLKEYMKIKFNIKENKLNKLKVPYIDKDGFNLDDIKNSKYFFA